MPDDGHFGRRMVHHSLASAAGMGCLIDEGISLLKVTTGVLCVASDGVRPFRHPHTIPKRVRIHPPESEIISTTVVRIHEVGSKHDRA